MYGTAAVDADITVGAVETQMTAPEVRRMVWQQTGVDGEETRTAVARWSGYAGELHVSRLHYAQPGLGQHVLNCSVFFTIMFSMDSHSFQRIWHAAFL